MTILPYVCAAIQAGASIVYLCNGEWRRALIWAGVALSNFALAGLK